MPLKKDTKRASEKPAVVTADAPRPERDASEPTRSPLDKELAEATRAAHEANLALALNGDTRRIEAVKRQGAVYMIEVKQVPIGIVTLDYVKKWFKARA